MGELDKRDQRTNTFLSRWKGGLAQLWSYSVSLRCLHIRITSKERKGNLELGMTGCHNISGPFDWEPCNFTFCRCEYAGKFRYYLIDSAAAFFLECATLEAAENVKPLYD